jgi:hypothetical protein
MLRSRYVISAISLALACLALPHLFGQHSPPAGTTPAPPPELKLCDPVTNEADVDWDDRCQDFQIITGIEQAGASSLPNQTNFFLSGFTRVSGRKNDDKPFFIRPWARVRILGAPTGSTGDVISGFQDPSGALKDLPKSKIGQAADFVFGLEVPVWGDRKQYSASFIVAAGGTTPLSSQDVISKFQVPAAGSQQCNLILDRFSAKNGYPAGLIQPGTGANCLANGITVLAFSGEDRSSFLRKYAFGFRTTFRYLNKNVATKDVSTDQPEEDPSKGKVTTTKATTTYTCCQSGMVDWTVGQDEAITGGLLRHWVFRMDGVYPLAFGKDKDAGWVYLFGTAAIRLQRNTTQSALILKADTSSAVPSDPNVALLPLRQPNKDFYRFGIGISIDKIFTKLATK